MRLFLAASLLILASMSQVHARVVYTSGSWSLHDASTRSNPHGDCTIFSTSKTNTFDWNLEITHPKNKVAVTEVLLKQEGRNVVGAWRANLVDGRTLAFPKLQDVRRISTYYGVPRDTAALIAQLDKNRNIEFKPADNTRDPRLTFRANGFSRVHEQFKRRCGAELIMPGFEEELLKLSDRDVDPMAITTEGIAELRKIYGDAFVTFQSMASNRGEMEKLTAKFQTQLNEAEQLTKNISQLIQVTIPSIEAAQRNNDQAEVRARTDLGAAESRIPGLTTAVNDAQEVLDKAQAAIAPFEPEYRSRYESATSARSAVDAGRIRIQDIDSQLSSMDRQISQLQNEYEAVLRNANTVQWRLDNAIRDLRTAERNYNSFDARNEIRARLARDLSYSHARSDLPRAEQDAHRLNMQVSQARRERDSHRRELAACRNATRPSDPSGSPAPEVDCSRQEANLRQSESRHNEILSHSRRAEARVADLRRRVAQAESRVIREVESIQRDLGNTLERARAQVRSHEVELNRYYARAESISRYEIPRLQDNISSLERERPMVVSEVARQTPIAARFEQELAQFKQKVGWDKLSADRSNAQGGLYNRLALLRNAQTDKANAERAISLAQSERARLNQDLSSKEMALSNAEGRLVEVRVSLEPYESEKSRLEVVATNFSEKLEIHSQDFDNVLPI